MERHEAWAEPTVGGLRAWSMVFTFVRVTPTTTLPAAPPSANMREVSLADRYELEDGMVHLSGVHALVRAFLDQLRADHAAGLNTGAMVSGYQGSPLGGFDKELQRARKVSGPLGLRHQPALNEELGATTVWGSQLATRLPDPTVDGVVGVWYGKAPGVDRAADALRHGNFSGADPKGGLVALCGDDPGAKSST